jgi:hypothetical protein
MREPTCKLCNDTGEQRYWEGRWRDERAENERLRADCRRLVAHWNEFGPEHGFEELIEGVSRRLNGESEKQPS